MISFGLIVGVLYPRALDVHGSSIYLIRKMVQFQTPPPPLLELIFPKEPQRTRNPGVRGALSHSLTIPVLSFPLQHQNVGNILLRFHLFFVLIIQPSSPLLSPISLFGSLCLLPKYKVFFGKLHRIVDLLLTLFNPFALPHLTLLPNSRPLCLSAEETNDHLFLHCPFGWDIMGKIAFKLLDLSLVIFERLWDFLLLLEIVYTWRGSREACFLCLHAMIWAIWKERNKRVFISRDSSSVWESFCILQQVGPKRIIFCLVFRLSLSV